MTTDQSPWPPAKAAVQAVLRLCLWRQRRWGGTCGNCGAIITVARFVSRSVPILRLWKSAPRFPTPCVVSIRILNGRRRQQQQQRAMVFVVEGTWRLSPFLMHTEQVRASHTRRHAAPAPSDLRVKLHSPNRRCCSLDVHELHDGAAEASTSYGWGKLTHPSEKIWDADK